MKKLTAILLALACVLSTAGCAATQTGGGQGAQAAYLLAEARYPEMAPYPNEADYIDQKTGEFDLDAFNAAYNAWRQGRDAQLAQPAGYAEGARAFYARSIPRFLSGTDGENRAYSPLNVYMALGMLAELTDSNSRRQILDLLGAADIDELRSQASAVWNANYCDDGAVTSALASSVWLNENVSFIQNAMDSLAETYYASSYRGEMGSDGFNKALRGWLSEQTGGLLKEQADGIELKAETVLALATTVYFKAAWRDKFSESDTTEGLFHLLGGETVECDFMRQSGSRNYYWGDNFSAVAQPFENAGSMWFILPDEGVSTNELLGDEQVIDFMTAGGAWNDSKYLTVNLTAPKFDAASAIDLIDGLKALGVTDVFDAAVSDFSPMTAHTDEIYVSQADHAARVVIDEEGCEAAAFTVMTLDNTSMPPEDEVDFILDRPFLFVVTGLDGLPLFAGVVNNPA